MKGWLVERSDGIMEGVGLVGDIGCSWEGGECAAFDLWSFRTLCFSQRGRWR